MDIYGLSKVKDSKQNMFTSQSNVKKILTSYISWLRSKGVKSIKVTPYAKHETLIEFKDKADDLFVTHFSEKKDGFQYDTDINLSNGKVLSGELYFTYRLGETEPIEDLNSEVIGRLKNEVTPYIDLSLEDKVSKHE